MDKGTDLGEEDGEGESYSVVVIAQNRGGEQIFFPLAEHLTNSYG